MLLVEVVVIGVLLGEPHSDGGGRDRVEFLRTASARCAAVGARDARYVYRARVAGNPALSGAVVAGCWSVRGPYVVAVFEDGDAYRIPKRAIQWSADPSDVRAGGQVVNRVRL